MNAFTQAFAEAGYRSPFDRASGWAIEAWAKWPQFSQGVARREFMANKFSGVPIWDVVQKFQPNALTFSIGCLLRDAEQAIKDQRPVRHAVVKTADRGDHLEDGAYALRVPAIPTSRDAGSPANDGGQNLDQTQRDIAPVVSPSRDAAKPQAERRSEPAIVLSEPKQVMPAAATILASKQAAAMASRVQTAITLSKLDTFKVNGQPIGDLTPDEIRAWLRSRGRDMRFAEALIAGVPPNLPVRKFWSDDQANAIYQRAEASHAA